MSQPYNAPSTMERRDWIAGLEKGLHLIEAFDSEHSRLTASQAAQRCGMTRTATRRYLLTLSTPAMWAPMASCSGSRRA